MIAILWCAVGLVALIAGGELLVRSGTRLAGLMGIPPILIGLTIVAIGTSTPELAVGIDAALRGNGALAMGNIAGTNIVNILFILGLSALLMPLFTEPRSLQFDLPVASAAAIGLLAMSWDGVLSRADGVILVSCGVMYTAALIYGARRESRHLKAEFASEYAVAPPRNARAAIVGSLVGLVVGISVTVTGADWLVEGATVLARQLGVSDAFIGLTVVAIGTSGPELVTTVVSTLRQQRDIAVGNLIGSGIYNIVFILGVTALIPADGIKVESELLRIDLPVMILVTLVSLPIFATGRTVSRREGGLMVAAYLCYLTSLIVMRG